MFHALVRTAPLRRAAALATCIAVSACGVGAAAFRPSEGPFLAPGPLPAEGGASLRATPAMPAGAPGRVLAPAPAVGASGMPVGLTANAGTALLPGAGIPGIGPVNGLVIPVSLGPRIPLRDDIALTRDLFGPEPGVSAPTLVEQMGGVSGGLFRATFEVMPSMVDSRRQVLPASPGGKDLMTFSRAVLRAWAAKADLSRWDNDGPDGIPSSGDDDGRIDFVVLVVETDATFPSVTLRQDFEVPTSKGTVRSGPIHILSLSRSEVADIGPAIGLWLDALGLDPGERFFPSTFPRDVSSLARARLGWLPVQPVLAEGSAPVPDGRALLYPLKDLAAGAGFWLIERDGPQLFVSRVARKADGHFFATDAHCIRRGEGQVLPLTRQFGERGPRVVIRWGASDDTPSAEMVASGARNADGAGARRYGMQ